MSFEDKQLILERILQAFTPGPGQQLIISQDSPPGLFEAMAKGIVESLHSVGWDMVYDPAVTAEQIRQAIREAPPLAPAQETPRAPERLA